MELLSRADALIAPRGALDPRPLSSSVYSAGSLRSRELRGPPSHHYPETDVGAARICQLIRLWQWHTSELPGGARLESPETVFPLGRTI